MQKYKEAIMSKVFLACACVSVMAIGLICLFLFAGGLPAMAEIGPLQFLLGREWTPMNRPPSFGILPMILGSFYITLGAIILGVPIGIFTAVFLAYICPKRIYVVLKPVVNLLAGIPSVVYGFFGAMAIVPVVRVLSINLTGGGTGASILSASVLLSIMILPTVVNISESAIRAVPKEYFEGAQALGASRIRSIFFVMVPAAKSGIMASIILGIGRAIGETMAVVMVAGNQALIPQMPVGLFRGARTLTSNIVLDMGYAADLHRDALIATAVVLFVFILLINIAFTWFVRRSSR